MSQRDLSLVEERLAAGMSLPDFFPYLGMSMVHASAEEVVVRMEVPAVLYSPFGAVHGGAIAALLDTAIGAAVACRLSPRDRTATHQLNINYITFTRERSVIATARVIRLGRTVAHAEAQVHAEDGTLIATALGTFGVTRARTE